MQKLKERNTYTPRDTSQVSCSVALPLNSLCGEMDSVAGLKTSSNNSDVNLHLPVGGHKAITLVYVLNKDGSPLMPCKSTKARHLLRDNKARVVKCNPFTIQLLWGCESNTQLVTLGIDAGYSHIGFSATTDKKELMSGEVKLRKDVSKKLTKKRIYRKNRRNKLWYRESRFLNRVSGKKKGWLAPSIQHKLDSHIRLVDKIKSLMPISEVIIEVASFDTQKMQNPEISGVEYQQGELQGYEIKEYLLEKWGKKCTYCGKKDIPLEIEHIIPKSRGGTDRVSNLTISCHKCNQKKSNKTALEFGHPEIQKKANQTLKATAFMNNVRWRLVDLLGCQWTYGYVTKHNRIKLRLEKSHSNDAFVIAGGNGQLRSVQYTANQVRRNNRCLQLNRKGFKPSIRKQRYKLQPHSLVKWNGQILGVKGVHCKGVRIILENKKSVKIDNVELYKYMRGWQFLSQLKQEVSLLRFL